VKQTREPGTRVSPPPPLEANDQLVTGVITVGWAIALHSFNDSHPRN